MAYRNDFIKGCAECHIEIEELSRETVLRIEPHLNPNTITAFRVPDGTFDPLRLALAFAASAQNLGAKFRLFSEVEGFLKNDSGNVTGIRIMDRTKTKPVEIGADIVVNAAGAWSGQIAALAGDETIPIKPTPGVMVTYNKRLCNLVINRLNEPGDGDIIVPQRQMVTVGTTSFEAEDLDYIPVFEDQVKLMLERGMALIPDIQYADERGAFMASRPLVDSGLKGRSLARTFKCFDHKESAGIDGLVTITGGKATTLRLMAEKTADLVCEKLGVSAECQTAQTPLLSYRQFKVDQW
jgi:glycerol-3-phosphate dehydrogenase